jgi:hypothetical protein
MSALLLGYNQAVERHRQQQEQTADDFNILEVMHLTGNEVRHSMMLGWLLDHDLRKLGTHAQGNLGFRLFLAEFGLPLTYAESEYWVGREIAGDESIVDIEVACRCGFLIHIENKISASEGPDQTDREWADVNRRAESLKARNVHALFLTPRGRAATNPKFQAISWGSVARVLENFAEQAKPADVKLFAAHYARTLRRFIVTRSYVEEQDDGEATDE